MVGLTAQQLARVRSLEIKARKMVRGLMVGDTISRQKGFGLEFDQLAEYQFGDDVRFIDWNSTARNNRLMIRHYRQEFDRTIYILVDISRSTLFGSADADKRQSIIQIAVVLALIGVYSKDAVGVIFFSDHVESYIPAKKGTAHFHAIMQACVQIEARGTQTNINKALSFLFQVARRESIVFMLSDFFDDTYQKDLAVLGRKHDAVFVRCVDALEHKLPSMGYVYCQDLETGDIQCVDTRSSSAACQWQQWYLRQPVQLARQHGIEFFDVQSNGYILEKVIMYLAKRG